MHLARTRSLFFLAFIACALIIGAVIYVQNIFGLKPCVLCLWQRWIFIAGGALCLLSCIHAPGRVGYRRYSLLVLLAALSGAGIAGGQVWLQAATIDELMPVVAGVERMLDFLSLSHLNERLYSDAISCSEINWSLFGISLPEWSLLGFVGLALSALYVFCWSWSEVVIAEGRGQD